MKSVVLSGSSRTGNNTLRVAKAMQQLLEQREVPTKVIDFIDYDIPFFNGPKFDIDSLTPFQKNLVNSWEESDLVIVISPEYNWFPSAELVNMIHQLGHHTFAHLFHKKVFAFAGVSSGRGGRLPSMQMSSVFEKLISHLNKMSVCSPSKYESHYSPQELSESGGFEKDTQYQRIMQQFIDYNLNLTQSLTFR